LSVGVSACRHAQFIATMLNGGATAPFVSSVGHGALVRCWIAAYPERRS
jgi:hypothetical protein